MLLWNALKLASLSNRGSRLRENDGKRNNILVLHC